MKFVVVLLLTALLGYAAPLYFSWGGFAVTSFIIALVIHQKAFIAFIAGFLGLFLLWLFLTLIIDNANQHILSHKIALLLPLNGSSLALIIITSLIGGYYPALHLYQEVLWQDFGNYCCFILPPTFIIDKDSRYYSVQNFAGTNGRTKRYCFVLQISRRTKSTYLHIRKVKRTKACRKL